MLQSDLIKNDIRAHSCVRVYVCVAVDQVSLELSEPVGWTVIPLSSSELDQHSAAPLTTLSPLRVHLLQIQIVAMHQNGRDTHLRQVSE